MSDETSRAGVVFDGYVSATVVAALCVTFSMPLWLISIDLADLQPTADHSLVMIVWESLRLAGLLFLTGWAYAFFGGLIPFYVSWKIACVLKIMGRWFYVCAAAIIGAFMAYPVKWLLIPTGGPFHRPLWYIVIIFMVSGGLAGLAFWNKVRPKY